MRHEIETNVFSDNKADVAKIEEICETVDRDHSGRSYCNLNRMRVTIMANINGAALRDLVTELDRAGFLD